MSGGLDGLRRAGLNLARGIVHAFNDKPKLQTVDFRGYQNELPTTVENFAHPFGHYGVPVPPDQQTKAAEVIMAFLDGNRSHPVILAHIDRRSRPTNGEDGQTGSYHPNKAMAMFRRKAFTHDGGQNKVPHQVVVGSTSVQAADGSHTTKVNSTTVLKEDGKITTDTATKIFTGTVHLGAGGSLAV